MKDFISKEADLPLEVVLLLIAGKAMLITGILHFPVASGKISYFENGLYGLVMFIYALQIKPPSGRPRSARREGRGC